MLTLETDIFQLEGREADQFYSQEFGMESMVFAW